MTLKVSGHRCERPESQQDELNLLSIKGAAANDRRQTLPHLYSTINQLKPLELRKEERK